MNFELRALAFNSKFSKEHASAVNVDRLAVDAATFIGRKQKRDRRDLFGSDQTTLRTHELYSFERVRCWLACFGFYLLKRARRHVRVNISGTDCVDCNTF